MIHADMGTTIFCRARAALTAFAIRKGPKQIRLAILEENATVKLDTKGKTVAIIKIFTTVSKSYVTNSIVLCI